MNYFDSQIAAERYQKGRPDFHANTINQIKNYLSINTKLSKALDIACGTGLSTKALLEIADHVWGTDYSPEMLSLALNPGQIKYGIAQAENQPFGDNEFDLITVCSGVHWFNIDKFLYEVHRLLKPKSWLVLYENFFLFEMGGVAIFNELFPQIYLQKFPSPPRNSGYSWTAENLLTKKFDYMQEERFKNTVVFSRKQLTMYFTTQSNVISAVTSGQCSYEEAENWIQKELEPFFETDKTMRTIYFGNWIKYIRRLD